MLKFYVPMGLSAMLASLTHVIISGVLARSGNPDLTISSYAVALSLAFILEQTLSLLRQTSAKFVKDRHSYRELARMIAVIVGIMTLLNIGIAWTPFGKWVFHRAFGAQNRLLLQVVDAYRVLMFVCLFSAVRSLYQGIIIQHFRTKWMTIGMGLRLIAMFGMSWAMIHYGLTNDSRYGALLFLTGMAIETFVALGEGLRLSRLLPDKLDPSPVRTWRQDLLPFYMPLLYGSMVGIVIGPATQTALNHTTSPITAIAAYAVAGNVVGLITSFSSFVHQAVLNFYQNGRRQVLCLVWSLSLGSTVFLSIIAWTPAGHRLLSGWLGIHGNLLLATPPILGIMIVRATLYPWIDFLNGIAMLRSITKTVALSKIGNVTASLALLALLTFTAPKLGGMIAAISGSIVTMLEWSLVWLLVKRSSVSAPVR